MTYRSRIIADIEYLKALGQAGYNFTFLEWGIVWTTVKPSQDGFASVPKGKPASEIAKAQTKTIEGAKPPLRVALRRRLASLERSYREAIGIRNKPFHGHQYTAPDESQQLGGGGFAWPIDEVNAAAKLFEDAAVECNSLFHGDLARERQKMAQRRACT